MFGIRTKAYSLIPQEDENLSPSKQTLNRKFCNQPASGFEGTRKRKSTALTRLTLVGLLVLNCTCTLVGVYLYRNDDKRCWNLHSNHSPLADHLDTRYRDIAFRGHITAPSPYRHDGDLPVPEDVDEAWLRVTNTHLAIPASKHDFESAGIPMDYIHLDESRGGSYPAMIEVFHQLHCLNFLRRSLWYHYPYYQNHTRYGEEFEDDKGMIRMHTNHCVDLIRQVLMCKADMGIIGLRWVEGYTRPLPDFSTRHKCLDFEQIVGWAQENAIPHQTEAMLLKPGPDDHVFIDNK